MTKTSRNWWMLAVLIVLAGVVGWVASRALAPKPAVETPSIPEADPFATAQVLYFDAGSDRLPADADTAIGRVADAARSREGSSVLIGAFVPDTGDAAQNADLAQRRSLTVRHALEANGVSPRALLMSRPQPASGADVRQTQRVEMRLQ